MAADPIRIVFVCLGNICRSPLAEYVVRDVAEKRGIKAFSFASAGTGDWHVGKAADHRALATAHVHGLDMSDHRAQQITARNLHAWDWFVVMDGANFQDVRRMGVPEDRLLLMRQFESDSVSIETVADVPDPYYGGPDGFEHAFSMLTANAECLLDYLQTSS